MKPYKTELSSLIFLKIMIPASFTYKKNRLKCLQTVYDKNLQYRLIVFFTQILLLLKIWC